MPRKRQQRKAKPFAAYAALIFNAALCLAPFIAARAISTAYVESSDTGAPRPLYDDTPESIAATRAAVEDRFKRIASSGQGDQAATWARYVGEYVETDLDMANSLMLAAQWMLKGPDAAALRERIAVTEGQGEQARIAAALPYLPEEIQVAYERQNDSFVARHVRDAKAEAGEGGVQPAVATGAFIAQAAAIPVSETQRVQLDLLGDMDNFSVIVGNWVSGEETDEFSMVLRGVGLTLAEPEAREGASVLLAARRAKRLDAGFQANMQHKLDSVIPPEQLKARLKPVYENDPYGRHGDAIKAAFRELARDQAALASLMDDLKVIRDIAHETSPSATVTKPGTALSILSEVKDGVDLRKGLLVSQAIGNAAGALITLDPKGFLDSARTSITWNNALKLQLAGLAACFALLVLISLNVLWRSVTRNKPRRRSAVYALDEVMAES